MKNSIFLIILLPFLTATSTANPPPQEFSLGISASFGIAGGFHTALSPHGEWLELDAGFYGWRPRHVHAGWRPYLHGHWSWTRYGWYWVSNELFGWAVFHYGRWYYDDYYGWIWIPDRTWGPAWVEWRCDDDYIGWAPLPPYASFSFSFGIRFTTHWFAPDRYWNFVRYRHMTSPSLYREVAPVDYARRLIRSTRSTGRYEYDGDRVINRGVDRSLVERRGGYRRLEPVDVQDIDTPRERQIRSGSRERIEAYRPESVTRDQGPARVDARRLERSTSLDLRRVERGSREMTRTPEPAEPERGTVMPDHRPSERAPRSIETPRDESTRRREQRVEPPQRVPIEPQQIDRRRSDGNSPFRREQMEQRRENRVSPPAQSNSRQREEVSPPRTRREEARPAPSIRQESPRGSERDRREGGRKRD